MLRCLVCQNQTIAESNAELALDLRRQIREQIAQNRSDREIIDYMVQRYGDFVLYRPPVEGKLVEACEGCRVGDRVRVQLLFTDVERGYIDLKRVG